MAIFFRENVLLPTFLAQRGQLQLLLQAPQLRPNTSMSTSMCMKL